MFPCSPRCCSLLISICLMLLTSFPALAESPQHPTELSEGLVAPVGTVITVQMRDRLSSETHSGGDTFVAVLQQPLVVDGWVVARRGQTVLGVVTSVNSAGRVKGTSDLTIELTEMVLVDGQQASIRTQLLRNEGKDTTRDDVATVAGATAIATAIGSAIRGGKGALIGAAIGAGAATAGVLSTKGKAAEIYPESTLSFRLDAPLAIATDRGQHAFVPVVPEDYNATPRLQTPSREVRRTTDNNYPRRSGVTPR